jgi:phosphoribosylamine--glycine ligase
LESSKSFAKEFLQRHRIPTAHYAICNSVEEVRDALHHFHTPLVVKADGLAAGKGVVICNTKEEAASVATEMLSGRMLGEAGARVVLEECLQGEELSFLVLSDGERVAPLVAAQDHKRIGDGDHGRLLHLSSRRRPDDQLAGAAHCSAGGGRNEGRGRRI